MASANAMAISKPEHENCTLWYSYLTDGVSDWSDPVDITGEFLRDRTNTHVGQLSVNYSFSDDLVEKERFIVYYGQPTSLDKIYLSGLTQSEYLVFDVYADDVAEGVIPARSIVAAKAQTVASHPRDTGNELITFSEATNSAFMVEVSGVQSRLSSVGYNLVKDGDFSGNEDGGRLLQVTGSGSSANLVSGGISYLQLITTPTSDGGVLSFQTIDQQGADAVTIQLSFDVIEAFTDAGGANPKVGAVSLGSPIDSSAYIAEDINEDDEGLTLSYSFTLASGEVMNQLRFSVNQSTNSGGNQTLGFTNIKLSVINGDPVYIPSEIDHRAIFFGKEIYQPDYNFNYGASLDNSAKYGGNQTQTSNYQHKKNSTRSHSLTLEHQSDDLMDYCEYLDYQLGDGYCFYQRDATKTDPKYYFLANFSHATTRNDFYNYNSTSLVLQEAHEWL